MTGDIRRYDLSTLLQPFPVDALDGDNSRVSREPITDLIEIGRLLTSRHLSSHPAASAQLGLHYSSARNLWSPTNGVQAAHRAIIRWRNQRGFVRLMPDDDALAPYNGIAADVPLLNGFRIPVEALLKHDPRSTLVLSSPNGISGRIATVQEIVQLARHFALVVIDERLAAFSMRRLTPLVSEWGNIMSVQQYPFIMPGQTRDFGWIIHPSAFKGDIARHLAPVPPETEEEVLSYGAINTFAAERHVARLKGQLYREMRKLSLVSVPYPSWSNALLARIERGDREVVLRQLADRGISVHAPAHANLRHHVRITAVSEDATIALRAALIEINRDIHA